MPAQRAIAGSSPNRYAPPHRPWDSMPGGQEPARRPPAPTDRPGAVPLPGAPLKRPGEEAQPVWLRSTDRIQSSTPRTRTDAPNRGGSRPSTIVTAVTQRTRTASTGTGAESAAWATLSKYGHVPTSRERYPWVICPAQLPMRPCEIARPFVHTLHESERDSSQSDRRGIEHPE